MSEEKGLVALLCEAKQVHANVLTELSQAICERDTARLELAAVRGELAKVRSEYDEAIGNLDCVFQTVGDRKAILPDFLLPGECKFEGVANLAELYRDTRSELDKLQAERKEIDNGDGTVTAILPVTYPKGMDVVEVREPRIGDEFISDIGERMTCTFSPRNEGRVRLILRPAPKPPEPVTWEAPLADGEWEASLNGAENDTVLFQWSYWGTLLHGLAKPAKLGKYRFKDGVGTLIEESK